MFPASIGHVYLAYNSFSNALLKFTPEDFRVVLSLIKPERFGRPAGSGRRAASIRKLLSDNGFLVPRRWSQRQQLERTFRSASRQGKTLSLTIAPTIGCNLRCTYCFVRALQGRMNQRVQEGLVEYVRRRLPRGGHLSVTWFGGEPLLEKEVIYALSEAFIRLCEGKGAGYSASVITNGVLLDGPTAKRLANLKVEEAQVTLDGPKPVHDRRRIRVSGRGTFDAIVRNLRAAREHIPVALRINVDQHNPEAPATLLKWLQREKMLDRVYPYLGHVTPFTDICKDISGECLSRREYSQLDFAFDLRKGLARGDRFNAHYPVRNSHFCQVDGNSGYVVGPSGALYKCYNDVGAGGEGAVGSVLHPQTREERNHLRAWRRWNPFSLEECRTCKFLPICLGGCPSVGRNLQPDVRGNCTEWRHTLIERLRYFHVRQTLAAQAGSI